MFLHQYSNAFVTAEYTRVLNEITSDTIQAAFTLPACNKKGLAFAMKVLNDVDFIDALRYAAVSYRTMLTGIWGSMITTMPQHWLDNLADQDYFAPALIPAARPVDKAALLNRMTNAPYVEADAHGLALPSTVTGYYDPSDLVAIPTPALTAAEISAISANQCSSTTCSADRGALFFHFRRARRLQAMGGRSSTRFGASHRDILRASHYRTSRCRTTSPSTSSLPSRQTSMPARCSYFSSGRWRCTTPCRCFTSTTSSTAGTHVGVTQREYFSKLQQAAAGRIIKCVRSSWIAPHLPHINRMVSAPPSTLESSYLVFDVLCHMANLYIGPIKILQSGVSAIQDVLQQSLLQTQWPGDSFVNYIDPIKTCYQLLDRLLADGTLSSPSHGYQGHPLYDRTSHLRPSDAAEPGLQHRTGRSDEPPSSALTPSSPTPPSPSLSSSSTPSPKKN